MRTVRYYEHGGPEVLKVEEVDVPVPGPGQVLIRTEGVGAGFIDIVARSGTGWFPQTPLPGSPCGDVVGVVEAVGRTNNHALIGSRVVDFVASDAFADYVIGDAAWAVPVPSTLDLSAASTLAMPGPMALHALRVGHLNKGESVLVHSAAGSIGALAVQLAKLEGAGTVIATGYSKEKLSFALGNGADYAVSYADPDWDDQVREICPRGVDLILDSVGGSISATSHRLLAPLGRLVIYGCSSGTLPELKVTAVLALRTITGFGLVEWRGERPSEARDEIDQIAEYAASGQLRVPVAVTLPLSEPAKVHEALASRDRVGRVMVIP